MLTAQQESVIVRSSKSISFFAFFLFMAGHKPKLRMM
jgi:hypothetical protein